MGTKSPAVAPLPVLPQPNHAWTVFKTRPCERVVCFGIWNLEFFWNLGFGIWNFAHLRCPSSVVLRRTCPSVPATRHFSPTSTCRGAASSPARSLARHDSSFPPPCRFSIPAPWALSAIHPLSSRLFSTPPQALSHCAPPGFAATHPTPAPFPTTTSAGRIPWPSPSSNPRCLSPNPVTVSPIPPPSAQPHRFPISQGIF